MNAIGIIFALIATMRSAGSQDNVYPIVLYTSVTGKAISMRIVNRVSFCNRSMRKVGEVEMKHPEYDSPFVLNLSDLTAQIAQNIDGMCLQAVQRVGINVDEEKLLAALNQDSKRYREAYKNGYDTGYETRDEEIIRCKACRHFEPNGFYTMCYRHNGLSPSADWYCADAERNDDDG